MEKPDSNSKKNDIYSIRKAENKDFKKILSLYKQLNPDVDFDSIDNMTLKSHWEEMKRQESFKIFILEKNKEILSVCTFIILNNISQGLRPNAILESFITDENHRGKGYGSKLLKYLLELAEEIGCHKVMLMVKPENNKAKKFYEKMGFNSKVRDGLSMILNTI